jgi:hypothetical protein
METVLWFIGAAIVVGVMSHAIDLLPIRVVQFLLVISACFLIWVTGAWEWILRVFSY